MSETDTACDVAIVGCGPVGQLLAMLLGKNGHRVTILERHPQFYPLPRAVTFDDETARTLAGIGFDPDNDAKMEYVDADYFLKNGDREILQTLNWQGEQPTGWRRWYWFNLPELQERFQEMLDSMPQVTLHRAFEVEGVESFDDHVEIHGTSTAGVAPEKQMLTARFVVGADGANSLIRELIGGGMTDLGFFYDWLIVDIRNTGNVVFDPPIWQFCDPKRPQTLVPGGPGRRRWEIMLLPGEKAEDLANAKACWDLIEPWGSNPTNCELERYAVWRFQAKWANRWTKGRMAIAGDAAHLTPPFAGQGMCAGLRDAVNLSWRLDLILKGLATPALLDAYGPERTEQTKYWINVAVEIGKVICVLDPEEAAARDRAMLAALQDPSLAPPPPPPPALGPGSWVESPGASMLSRQGRVAKDGRHGRFDDFVPRGWHLIGLDHVPGTDLPAEVKSRFEALGGSRITVTTAPGAGKLHDEQGTYARWFAELGAEVVLVRPDHYVAFSARKDEVAGMLDQVLQSLKLTA
ncbi:MAG: bifunctional 3-(3-hydroxy-phenyl)propionate/3-hydroxycinnamic acid hydroxylase [Rhodobacterales bacterium]|nr:bifunctional 3-(3-hydroxy-phenyl)propionate/3-hydroxycinnamic acid hydroxylase [Rhodobacterales bacterium]